jgi:hypothetical protein
MIELFLQNLIIRKYSAIGSGKMRKLRKRGIGYYQSLRSIRSCFTLIFPRPSTNLYFKKDARLIRQILYPLSLVSLDSL